MTSRVAASGPGSASRAHPGWPRFVPRARSASETPPRGGLSWPGTRIGLEVDFGLDLRHALSLLLRRWKWIVASICVAMGVGFVVTLVSPEEYRSAVELLPSGPSGTLGNVAGLGSAMGLASGLGFNLGSPNMMTAYPDMLKSRQIRERVLDREFQVASGRRAPLVDLLGFTGEPYARRAKGLAYLDRKIRVALDDETGVLQVVASLPEAELARAVAAAYVEELVRIEEEIEKTTSFDNMEFIQIRLQDAKRELRAAENAVEAFQERNVRLGTDPEVQLEAARLARELRIQEEIYLTLTRQLEFAKIEASREDAGIQVIDPPQSPLARSSPSLLKNVVLGGILGFVATSLLIVGTDWWASIRRQMCLTHPRGDTATA